MKNNINWNFDNSYSKLPESFKEIIKPVSVLKPELVILNENLAKELGLNFSNDSSIHQKHPPAKYALLFLLASAAVIKEMIKVMIVKNFI